MLEQDKQMLTAIEEDFQNGLKVSDRRYLNLDDEQIQWMIKTIKSYDQSLYYYETYTEQQFKGNLNLLEIKRELEKQVSLKDTQIQDLTVLSRGLKRELEEIKEIKEKIDDILFVKYESFGNDHYINNYGYTYGHQIVEEIKEEIEKIFLK